MLLLQSIYKRIAINQIIAPHGITDLFHAYDNQNYRSLFLSYGGSLILSQIVSPLSINNYSKILLFLTSIVHFNRDFKMVSKQKITSYLLSTLNTSLLVFYPEPYLYLYMVFVHVPNHYYQNRILIDKYKVATIISVLSLGSFMYVLERYYSDKLYSLFIGIIIGHIIYNEIANR